MFDDGEEYSAWARDGAGGSEARSEKLLEFGAPLMTEQNISTARGQVPWSRTIRHGLARARAAPSSSTPSADLCPTVPLPQTPLRGRLALLECFEKTRRRACLGASSRAVSRV